LPAEPADTLAEVTGWLERHLDQQVTVTELAALAQRLIADDNPYSESQFRTMKYRPEMPEQLGSLEHARQVTRVLVDSADRDGSWTTIGVDENIIEASWKALLDSLHYALLRAELRGEPQHRS